MTERADIMRTWERVRYTAMQHFKKNTYYQAIVYPRLEDIPIVTAWEEFLSAESMTYQTVTFEHEVETRAMLKAMFGSEDPVPFRVMCEGQLVEAGIL